ncbi:MAG: YigZ family protein [Ruminococcus sp.]|nr:YigZ family protein [Ruminococcus sp.]
MGYITIKDRTEASFIEKRSEFIGYLAPVTTHDDAISFIDEIKSRHRKATHNVYAYILRDNNTTRHSDDGEPQGTAGIPVLDVLKKRGLTDICCVVTRYFGGILLGGGGLVRAYSHATSIAVDSATIMNMCSCYQLRFSMDYTLYAKVNYILTTFDIKMVDTNFSDCVTITLLVKVERFDELYKKLIDASNGSIRVEKSAEMFMDFNA